MKKLDVIKIIIVFAMVCGFMFKVNAQSADRHWAIGAYANIMEYSGDLGDEFFSFDFEEVEIRGGLSIAKYLSPSFDLMGRFSVGQINAVGEDKYAGSNFNAAVFNTNVNLVYKFYNGYLIPEDFIIQPYVLAGLGGNKTQATGQSPDWLDFGEKDKVLTHADFYAGLGFKVRVSPSVGIVLQSGWHLPFSDRLDAVDDGAWDQIWEHNVGATYNIPISDEDADGVSDANDRCPETPEKVEVDRHGCAIDTDGDGVADYLDSCVYEPGLIRFNGCPDTDGDNIMDSEDACPEEPGIKKFDGCPDTDRDGIEDRDDDCPEQPGPLEMNGCPCDYKPVEFCGDDDGDGVSNSKDKCPETPKGVKVDEDGCALDTDGDGVPDHEDKCPDVAGKASAEGCPSLSDALGAESLEKINAAETVKFETAKAVIRPKGKETLDRISEIMKEHDQYHIQLSGYCDSRGTEAFNLDLSKRRAASVRQYLIDKGIAAERIAAEGYGEANPIATNATPEGRQLNRRVEFKIYLP